MSDKLFEKAQHCLHTYWGYDSFRPGQAEAIRSVLEGCETLVLFPTGGGKSLCYQVPATVLDGLTLVVSPLVALMQDQVKQLNDKGISASFVNSTLSSWEVEQRLVNARNGMYKLFYCAPERLKTHLFQAEMENLNIQLVAIDEAHCISQWGHDFRPSYRDIRPALEPIAETVGWVALTATATPEVRDDIIDNLAFEEPAVISRGFERPNLKWWVVAGDKKDEKLFRTVKKGSRKGSGIIYGGTRRNCERLAREVTRTLGIVAKAYHAGVEDAERKKIQEQWLDGALPLVVATSAFGMGIDKADCRYVIHYEMPYSLEAYYQEAGRAGRDGEEAYPVLLYRPSDALKAERRLKDAYPARKQLVKLYDSLCDELGLAVGSGMESAEQVSVEALARRSHLPIRKVRSSLKVLNQLGVIQLIEHVAPQVSLQFVVSRDRVRSLVEEMPNKEKAAFLDTVFRQFGNEAFAETRSLDLDYLRYKLNTTRNGVIKGLQVLQNHDHLIHFEAIGEMPLVRLIDERVAKLPFGKQELQGHRDSLLKKLQKLVGYIETAGCREVYIRTYFGETGVAPCGHCDNCLEQPENGGPGITEQQVEAVREALQEGGGNFRDLQRLTAITASRLKETLALLIREEKVETVDGRYIWRT